MNRPFWKCRDCQYRTSDEDEALKHSAKKHPPTHTLDLVEK